MSNNVGSRVALFIATAAVACLPWLTARARQVKQALPIVTSMAPPTYPVVAREARIEGTARLKITTDGHRVTDTHVQGNPPLLLAALAEKNVRTWQFEPGDPTTFEVTYAYKLVKRSIRDADGTSVTLELPTDVEISATVPLNVDLAPDK